jgi:hypothetical protein
MHYQRMAKIIRPGRFPKAIGLFVGVIFSLLLLMDVTHAAVSSCGPARTIRPPETSRRSPEPYRGVGDTGPKIFEPGGREKSPFDLDLGKKTSDPSRSIIGDPAGSIIKGKEDEGYSPHRPQLESLRAVVSPKSRSKEVLKAFEPLSIKEICEDTTSQLLPLHIQSVQRLLNDLTGSSLPTTGELDPSTRECISQFQRSRWFPESGTLDEQTAQQLIAETYIRGETMVQIAVSSAGKCRIIRSSDDRALAEWKDGAPVDSLKDLKAYMGNGPSLLPLRQARSFYRRHDEPPHHPLLVSGADLPRTLKRALEAQGFRTVRISDRSPKKTLQDHMQAARLASTKVDPDMTILSALPRASSESDMRKKLSAMNLSEGEMPRWLGLDYQLRELKEEFSGKEAYLQEVNKPQVLEELSGDSDVTFLIAHLDRENLYLPNGDIISGTEIDGLSRNSKKRRVIVLFLCEAGNPKSLGERLIANGLADLVIAPPDFISAREVPEKVRQLWLGEKSLEEIFPKEQFQMWSRLEASQWVS